MRFMVATASTGYCPDADSADSMTASAPSKIAVATSETSARVGTGLEIIDSSIWVATTIGLPARRHARVISFCTPGTRSSGISTPEIAARDHQRVCDFENFAKPRHCLRLLDLGHHRGAAARELFRFGDVLRALNERQSDPIDAGIESGLEISNVFRRQRRQRHAPCPAG